MAGGDMKHWHIWKARPNAKDGETTALFKHRKPYYSRQTAANQAQRMMANKEKGDWWYEATGEERSWWVVTLECKDPACKHAGQEE